MKGHSSNIVNKPGKNKQPRKKILIADDDQGIQDIFRIILDQAGYDIEIKSGGEELLKNDFTIPDLFLIDRQLSGYDGVDICIHLKSQELTKHIPVVMVSASPDIATLAKKAGADFFVEKPFDMKELLRIVDHYINS
jgi:CheY-like chemotaxis protein